MTDDFDNRLNIFTEAVKEAVKEMEPLGVRIEETETGFSIICPDEWFMYCEFCAYWERDIEYGREGICWNDRSENHIQIMPTCGFCMFHEFWNDNMEPCLGTWDIGNKKEWLPVVRWIIRELVNEHQYFIARWRNESWKQLHLSKKKRAKKPKFEGD